MIIFRADGNPTIGLGHVMRDLSIADAFRNFGEQCCFCLADAGLSELIINRGHAVKVLGSRFDRMDDELEIIKKEIHVLANVSAVFIDSYYVTENYLSSMHSFCQSRGIILVYVDDVLSFPYSCDVLINYNIYASFEQYRTLYHKLNKPVFLLGTAYAPLRTEFQQLQDRVIRIVGRDVLISTGGSDSTHVGIELIRTIIETPEWSDIRFHFILGILNEDYCEIEELAKGSMNIQIHENVSQMAELMKSCDVAITAAGSTMYELCATQTPSITYILADNQIPGANGFEKSGVLHTAGDIRIIGMKKLARSVLCQAIDLLNNYNERNRIAKIMRQIVDGKGANRIVNLILK